MQTWVEAVRTAFHDEDHWSFRWVTGVVWTLIIISILLFLQELAVGREGALGLFLNTVDDLLLYFFIVEIVARIVTVPPRELDFYEVPAARRLRIHIWARIRYSLEPLNLIDIITVLAVVPQLRGLRAVRLLRLLRTARVFRYSLPFQGLQRAFYENQLLYAFGFSLLGTATLVGGTTVFLVEQEHNPDINGLGDGLWWAIVTLTTVGFGDISPVTFTGRIVASVLMVIGMFTLALFAGIVSNTLLGAVLSIREEGFRMSGFMNHIVICGWDQGSEMLLPTLTEEIDPDKTPIVIFAPGERPSTLSPLFTWVPGDPTKESELPKARIEAASQIIIVAARDDEPTHADADTILTAFTVRRYMTRAPGAENRRLPLYIVAEILDQENVEHAYTAGCDEVVETTRIGFSMMTHALVQHGSALAITRMVEHNNNDLWVSALPFPDEHDELEFHDLVTHMKLKYDVMVLGYRDGSSGVDRFNPPGHALIHRGTQLLYLGTGEISSND